MFTEFETLQRKGLANCVRAMRREGKPNKIIQRVLETFEPPRRPRRPCLADSWPCEPFEGGLCSTISGDGESWRAVYLLPGRWSDDDIRELRIEGYYNGPGRGYGNEPVIKRGPFSTIIYQSGGMDV